MKFQRHFNRNHMIILFLSCAFVAVLFSTAAAYAAPQKACGGYHYVQRGDTLFSISKQYGIPIPAIMQANPGIPNPNRIYAGTRIYIPCGPGGPGVGGPCRYVHTIAWGDTLGEIALRYGVSRVSIARANGIPNMDLIYAGRTLCIP